MWPGQDELEREKERQLQAELEKQGLKARETAIWQKDFRLRQQLDQKWTQILREFEEGLLNREAFDGYRQMLRRLCHNNGFRIVDKRLVAQ